MRFIAVNSTHLLLELRSLEETLALFESLTANLPVGVTEITPAARTLLIRFQPLQTSPAQLVTEITQRPRTPSAQHASSRVTIPVDYQGEDLAWIAQYLDISIPQLIEQHQNARWKVAFTGFAPGFAYITSADWHWQIPRRSSPRTRIAPGSVAVAGTFSGIYPQASPGGWQIMGHTEQAMWDIQRSAPALLTPGTEVEFVACEPRKTVSLPTNIPRIPERLDIGGLKYGQPGCKPYGRMRVVKARLPWGCLPQAMDKQALYSANRIVGNPRNRCCLEITLGGLRIKAHQDMVVAVTGALCPLTLHTSDNEHFQLPCYQPVNLTAGDELWLGTPLRGLRSYLAVRHGFVVPDVLGSASRDTLAQLGPEPLKAGDRIALQQSSHAVLVLLDQQATDILPKPGECVTLDILLGPRTDWFTDEAVRLLATQRWRVTPQSNRIGLRLDGDNALERQRNDELPSEGTCSGAIQIPANGQPVLFLRDHPVTGGYPVMAVVAEHHLDLAGQIPPGAFIHFNIIQPFTEFSGEPGL